MPPSGANGFILAPRAAIALHTRVIRTMARWPLRNLLGPQAGKSDSITLHRYEQAVELAG